MTQETTQTAISAVLSAAADTVERDEMRRYARDIGQHGAGGEIYTLLFQAAERLYGWPAVQHLQTQLGSQIAHGHLQHWRETDSAAVVKVLREAAGVTPEPDVEVAAMREQVERWWAEVCKGLPWLATQPVASRADEVVREFDRLRRENDQIRVERDRWRQQYEEQLAATRALDDLRMGEIDELDRALERYQELAAEERKQAHDNPAYLADNLAATKVERDEFAAEAERLRAELDAIGDLAYRCDPTSPFVGDCLAQIHTRAKNAVKE